MPVNRHDSISWEQLAVGGMVRQHDPTVWWQERPITDEHGEVDSTGKITFINRPASTITMRLRPRAIRSAAPVLWQDDVRLRSLEHLHVPAEREGDAVLGPRWPRSFISWAEPKLR